MEFFIIREGQQTGPFSEASVQTMLKEGKARAGDMGWRKGLPSWLPLGEILQPQPGFVRPNDPPPMNATQSGVKHRPLTAKQRALLNYLSIAWDDSMSREHAAVVINDALENPKLTARFAKWGEEKLRHPDVFQDEIDFRRANRVQRYLELCQTEANEVVQTITKAHIQVLMESLDKREPGWEQNSRAALWDFLLPCVNEHFPQLIREEWKGKLKFGGTPKIAATYTGTPGTDSYVPPGAPTPGAMQAALRGVVYGVLALGIVLAGVFLFRDKPGDSAAAKNAVAPAPAAVKPAAFSEHPVPPPPADPNNLAANTPPIDALPPGPKPPEAEPAADAVPGAPGVPAPAVAPAPGDPATPAPPAVLAVPGAPPAPGTPAPIGSIPPADPGAAPAPVPAPIPAPAFTPAPPPPGAAENPPAVPPGTTPPAPAPGAPAVAPALVAGPVARNAAVLTKATDAQLQFGKVTLPVGTKVKLIALEGQNLRVNFNNNIVLIPVANTDVDPANTIITPPAAPLPTVAPPPVVPVPAPAPAPKPGPSSDL